MGLIYIHPYPAQIIGAGPTRRLVYLERTLSIILPPVGYIVHSWLELARDSKKMATKYHHIFDTFGQGQGSQAPAFFNMQLHPKELGWQD